MKENKVLQIFKIGGILFLITAVAALLLAVINNKTAPLIAQNQEKKQTQSMQTVMPQADAFEKLSLPQANDQIKDAYTAKDAAGALKGICVIVESLGYGGPIQMAVGIDASCKVTGVDLISLSETPGLGANATKDSFKSQYAGKTAKISVVKSGAAENEINAMSGATITSKAVTEGVNQALEFAATALSETEGGNQE